MLREVAVEGRFGDFLLRAISYHEDRPPFYLSRAGQPPDPLAVTRESGHSGTWSVTGSSRMSHGLRMSRFKLLRLDASVLNFEVLAATIQRFAGPEWIDAFIEHFPVPGIHDKWVCFPGIRLHHSGGGVAFAAIHGSHGKWQKMPYWAWNGLDPGFMFLVPTEEDEPKLTERPRELQ